MGASPVRIFSESCLVKAKDLESFINTDFDESVAAIKTIWSHGTIEKDSGGVRLAAFVHNNLRVIVNQSNKICMFIEG